MIIEVNVFLIDRKLMELDIPQDGEKARMLLDLSNVEAIRDCLDADGKSKDECLVCFKSGENIIVDQSYNAMRKVWARFLPVEIESFVDHAPGK